jgi:hypothetical protein
MAISPPISVAQPWRGAWNKKTPATQKSPAERGIMHRPHPHGRVVEKDELTPERIGPYALDPDFRDYDMRGPMQSDVIIYDRDGAPTHRILKGTRERVPFGQRAVPAIEKPLRRALSAPRARLRKAALEPVPADASKLQRVARALNPGR